MYVVVCVRAFRGGGKEGGMKRKRRGRARGQPEVARKGGQRGRMRARRGRGKSIPGAFLLVVRRRVICAGMHARGGMMGMWMVCRRKDENTERGGVSGHEGGSGRVDLLVPAFGVPPHATSKSLFFAVISTRPAKDEDSDKKPTSRAIRGLGFCSLARGKTKSLPRDSLFVWMAGSTAGRYMAAMGMSACFPLGRGMARKSRGAGSRSRMMGASGRVSEAKRDRTRTARRESAEQKQRRGDAGRDEEDDGLCRSRRARGWRGARSGARRYGMVKGGEGAEGSRWTTGGEVSFRRQSSSRRTTLIRQTRSRTRIFSSALQALERSLLHRFPAATSIRLTILSVPFSYTLVSSRCPCQRASGPHATVNADLSNRAGRRHDLQKSRAAVWDYERDEDVQVAG
ncbi:hypothetical protein C8R44DRAFT_752351 [Mycena epipterygia]|nr:hypothetical protein C8R44DRAFT_752351 [Mycena epipterygia]